MFTAKDESEEVLPYMYTLWKFIRSGSTIIICCRICFKVVWLSPLSFPPAILFFYAFIYQLCYFGTFGGCW